MTPLEALIEVRQRTQNAHDELVGLLAGVHGQRHVRLSHKISGVNLALGYIDDALRLCDATAIRAKRYEDRKKASA